MKPALVFVFLAVLLLTIAGCATGQVTQQIVGETSSSESSPSVTQDAPPTPASAQSTQDDSSGGCSFAAPGAGVSL